MVHVLVAFPLELEIGIQTNNTLHKEIQQHSMCAAEAQWAARPKVFTHALRFERLHIWQGGGTSIGRQLIRHGSCVLGIDVSTRFEQG
jgi:hypothetical protein